jgi:hypothetical protein
MLLSQDGVSRVKEALAQYRKNIAAVEAYLVDEIGLARENRELLIAVYRVNRLDPNPFNVERLSRVRHDDAVLRDSEFRDCLQAGTRQHKSAAVLTGDRPDRRGVAVISMMVSDERYIDLTRDLIARDWRRSDLHRRAEVEVDTNQHAVGLDQPARVAHPPYRQTALVRSNLLQHRRHRRLGGTR